MDISRGDIHNKKSKIYHKRHHNKYKTDENERNRGCRGPEGKIGPTGPTGPSGCSMGMAIGEIYYQGSNITILSDMFLPVNIPTQLKPPTTLITTEGSFDSPQNGVIRYIGEMETLLHCAFSLSIKPRIGDSQLILLELRKNGEVIPGGGFLQTFRNSSDFQGVAFHKVVYLKHNDYLCVSATNLSFDSILDIYNMNIVCVGD